MTTEKKKLPVWASCLLWSFLIVCAFLFITAMLMPPFGQAKPDTIARLCRQDLEYGWKVMRHAFADAEGNALTPPPEWTVQDMILETDYPLFEKCPVCLLGRKQGYLVFPEPASVVFDESLQPPVPIVMDLPGTHREFGTNVLYSDGTVKILTAEEAEKLVAERSPVPYKSDWKTRQTVRVERDPAGREKTPESD